MKTSALIAVCQEEHLRILSAMDSFGEKRVLQDSFDSTVKQASRFGQTLTQQRVNYRGEFYTATDLMKMRNILHSKVDQMMINAEPFNVFPPSKVYDDLRAFYKDTNKEMRVT
jgi:hypothetical protein